MVKYSAWSGTKTVKIISNEVKKESSCDCEYFYGESKQAIFEVTWNRILGMVMFGHSLDMFSSAGIGGISWTFESV